MTDITINKLVTITKDLTNIKSMSFDYLGHKVYGAEKIQKIFGVFVSDVVVGSSNLVSWNTLEWEANKELGTDVEVYLKSASTEASLNTAIWSGPYLNPANDISSIKSRYLQFVVVISNDGTFYEVSSSSSSSLDSSSSSSQTQSSSSSTSYRGWQGQFDLPRLYVLSLQDNGFTVKYENVPEEIGYVEFEYIAS